MGYEDVWIQEVGLRWDSIVYIYINMIVVSGFKN